MCYVFLLCMRIISHSQFSCIYSLVKLPITGVTDIYLVNMQHNLSVNMTVSSLLLSWLPRQSGQRLYEETSYFLWITICPTSLFQIFKSQLGFGYKPSLAKALIILLHATKSRPTSMSSARRWTLLLPCPSLILVGLITQLNLLKILILSSSRSVMKRLIKTTMFCKSVYYRSIHNLMWSYSSL